MEFHTAPNLYQTNLDDEGILSQLDTTSVNPDQYPQGTRREDTARINGSNKAISRFDHPQSSDIEDGSNIAANRNVLLIAYEYPPIGGVGIIRTLKWSKYLPSCGWNPHVLTVRNRDRFYTTPGSDTCPESVTIYRSTNILNNLFAVEGGLRRLGLSSKMLVPDPFVGWIPATVRLGEKIIREEDIDVIYASSPPYTSAIIGARLKERTGVPFVLDLRDAWTLNPYNSRYALESLRRLDQRLEQDVLNTADAVITATEGIREDYCASYPELRPKMNTILNGFDLDDIPASFTPFEKFTITYTGFFYGSRSPEPLFAALRDILRGDLIPEEDLQFLWAGRNAPFAHQLAAEYEVSDIVRYQGLISKRDADALMYQSHLLYFVIGPTEDGGENTTLTGKIFPYLASGKPILAVIPDGSARTLITTYSDNSYIITNWDKEEIVHAILDAYRIWKTDTPTDDVGEKTRRFRERFNYRTLTGDLASILETVAKDA